MNEHENNDQVDTTDKHKLTQHQDVESFELDDKTPVDDKTVVEQPEPTGETNDSEIPKSKQQNVFIDAPLSIPDPNEEGPSVPLPSDFDKRTGDALGKVPNVEFTDTKQGSKWADTIRGSLGMSTYDEAFVKTLEDPEAEFHQTLESNNRRFGSGEVRFKEQKNTIFDGEMAVLRTISHLGLGTTWNTGLYNSGLWIIFKPPSEDSLVELYRLLTSDKIEMGRYSYGLAYSNTVSYTVSRLCQFALDHVYQISANSKEINSTNVLQYLRVQDIDSLLWGMACTMFPNGFSFSRACVANPEKCQNVTREILNLRKLQVVNRRVLSERQKDHMAIHRTSKTMTVKELQSYQADMTRASIYRVTVNEGEKNEISFNLRSPSIAEYIQTGHQWIESIVETVDQALGSTASIEERNRLVELRSKASIMRQYSHWVESIEIDSNQIKDKISIEKILNNLGSDRTIRDEFIKGVRKYIDNSSVSVIGIPTYDCPKCGQTNEGPESFPHRTTMIPLDVIQLFFVLLTQKHLEIMNR